MAAAAIGSAWVSLSGFPLYLVVAGIALAIAMPAFTFLRSGEYLVRGLELGSDRSARWQDAAGHWHDAELLPDSYVSNWLIVLNLGKDERRIRSFVFLPDSAPAEDLRQLRVWVRWRMENA